MSRTRSRGTGEPRNPNRIQARGSRSRKRRRHRRRPECFDGGRAGRHHGSPGTRRLRPVRSENPPRGLEGDRFFSTRQGSPAFGPGRMPHPKYFPFPAEKTMNAAGRRLVSPGVSPSGRRGAKAGDPFLAEPVSESIGTPGPFGLGPGNRKSPWFPFRKNPIRRRPSGRKTTSLPPFSRFGAFPRSRSFGRGPLFRTNPGLGRVFSGRRKHRMNANAKKRSGEFFPVATRQRAVPSVPRPRSGRKDGRRHPERTVMSLLTAKRENPRRGWDRDEGMPLPAAVCARGEGTAGDGVRFD
jgi:hypothetical protein